MRILLAVLLWAAVVLPSLAGIVAAQPRPCGTALEMAAVLMQGFGELAIEARDGRMFFANGEIMPDGSICLAAFGQGWKPGDPMPVPGSGPERDA